MKKISYIIIFSIYFSCLFGQETILPALPQSEKIALVNGTIHVGNGSVIENGSVVFEKGKIIAVGLNVPTNGMKTIDCKGKHIYPGLILPASKLGLIEVNSIRATIDAEEIGDFNPSMRSIVAYNTDSKVINTLRPNGILLANVVPDGGTISGTSSVVQLDAWNWEDAAYKSDVAMVLRMPSLLNSGVRVGQRGQRNDEDRLAMGLKKVEDIKAFFREAKAYLASEKPSQTNLKFESLRNLFDGKQKLFVHCSIVKEMLVAIELSKEFGFEITLVGAEDSWQIADVLKTHNISVILNSMHSLPTMIDDDVDQPYKTPAILKKAGVLFAINDNDEHNRYRNLPFNAGTACAFGLAKEEALQAITLNTAKILGIDSFCGTLETGKDATLFISEGDALDMRTNKLKETFIQGRRINLENHQSELNAIYKEKYNQK